VDPQAAAMLSIERMIEIRNSVAVQLKGKVTNLGVIRLEALRRILKDIGKPNDALADHLNQVYLKHRFEDIELFDDVLLVLKTLQMSYTLGLLSNGNSSLNEPVCPAYSTLSSSHKTTALKNLIPEYFK